MPRCRCQTRCCYCRSHSPYCPERWRNHCRARIVAAGDAAAARRAGAVAERGVVGRAAAADARHAGRADGDVAGVVGLCLIAHGGGLVASRTGDVAGAGSVIQIVRAQRDGIRTARSAVLANGRAVRSTCNRGVAAGHAVIAACLADTAERRAVNASRAATGANGCAVFACCFAAITKGRAILAACFAIGAIGHTTLAACDATVSTGDTDPARGLRAPT